MSAAHALHVTQLAEEHRHIPDISGGPRVFERALQLGAADERSP